MEKPPEVIEQQGDVKAQSYPLPRTHEHQTEQPVDGILWNNQPSEEVADSLNVQYSFPRSCGVALIDRVFEVCAQLIKRNNLEKRQTEFVLHEHFNKATGHFGG